MITFTQLGPAALDEAAAIVEAEWMRLQRRGAADNTTVMREDWR